MTLLSLKKVKLMLKQSFQFLKNMELKNNRNQNKHQKKSKRPKV